MKRAKFLLTAALSVMTMASFAQDLESFNNPAFAKYGETLEQRKENYLNSTFLKESIANRDYGAATDYLKALVENCPTASENIYVNGTNLYKAKIQRAKSLAEKRGYVDSLMWVYDLRNLYFGDHATRGSDYILDRKARELLTYDSSDREGIRQAFTEAIDAAVAKSGKADPELVAIYFKNLCDDYKNDEVSTAEILETYERLSPMFDNIKPEQEEHKNTFEVCFGLSGAASCENLEALFSKKLAAAPDDPAVLGQAVSLMSRANCDSDFFFSTAEHYYEINPSSDTALFLAQGFQNRKEFDKANTYLREALKTENDPAERVKLLVRVAVVELAAQHFSASAEAASEAVAIDPANGYAYYIQAQAFAMGNSGCDNELARGAAYWVAYDVMAKAVQNLDGEPETKATAQETMSRYRRSFPTQEECFFNELKEGSSYVVDCGVARGRSTTVRYRPQ
ncbi:MAG: enzyme of heme biosynthesis [Alistipes sp.]|nr:enzyme of heme biosynthesis [Alistipes sp.]